MEWPGSEGQLPSLCVAAASLACKWEICTYRFQKKKKKDGSCPALCLEQSVKHDVERSVKHAVGTEDFWIWKNYCADLKDTFYNVRSVFQRFDLSTRIH